MKLPNPATVLPWFREYFLLTKSEERSRSHAPGQQAAIAGHVESARRHHGAARQLSRPGHAASSVLLYRAAILACLRAIQASDPSTSVCSSDPSELARLLEKVGASDREVQSARRCLFDDDITKTLQPKAIRELLVDLDRVVRALDASVESRNSSTIAVVRTLRIAIAALVFACAALLAVTAFRVPKNFALHKPITSSSILYGSPDALVNGSIEWGNFSFHSNRDSPAWVVIDLEALRTLHEVRIFNRGDAYLDDAIGTRVELSNDGKNFRTVATCTEVFTQATPCRLMIDGARARFVKVSHPTHVALSEIEVLGPR